jgi:hypothetical protein
MSIATVAVTIRLAAVCVFSGSVKVLGIGLAVATAVLQGT